MLTIHILGKRSTWGRCIEHLSMLLVSLVFIMQVNVSLNYGGEVIDSAVSANRDDREVTSVFIFVNIKVNDTTFLVEEGKVLIVVSTDKLNKIVLNWD